jgi:hypothetical protein
MKRIPKWIALGGAGFLAAFSSPAAAGNERQVARGKYLVTAMGCNDCHTPLKMGPRGPEPDMSRMLSGHPQELVMPPAPKLPEGPWAFVVGGTMTAWSGPWGVSFSANLTPDRETGLGTWTVQNFIEALRTGRHMGRGRPILPPMPYQMISTLTDADLQAVFGYLKTIPPIRNQVPSPVPPAEMPTARAQ